MIAKPCTFKYVDASSWIETNDLTNIQRPLEAHALTVDPVASLLDWMLWRIN